MWIKAVSNGVSIEKFNSEHGKPSVGTYKKGDGMKHCLVYEDGTIVWLSNKLDSNRPVVIAKNAFAEADGSNYREEYTLQNTMTTTQWDGNLESLL